MDVIEIIENPYLGRQAPKFFKKEKNERDKGENLSHRNKTIALFA